MLHQNCQDVDPADMRPRVGTVTVGFDDVESPATRLRTLGLESRVVPGMKV